MNAYQDACADVEEPAKPIFERFIAQYFPYFVFTHKGRLAKQLQCSVGDALAHTKEGPISGIEFKTEVRWTGNLFLETWSNKHWDTPGWLRTLDADLLFYLFTEKKVLYSVRFQDLKAWAYPNGSDESEAFRSYAEKRQSKRDQPNDTWGRCVPIAVLEKEAGLMGHDMTPYWLADD